MIIYNTCIPDIQCARKAEPQESFHEQFDEAVYCFREIPASECAQSADLCITVTMANLLKLKGESFYEKSTDPGKNQGQGGYLETCV